MRSNEEISVTRVFLNPIKNRVSVKSVYLEAVYLEVLLYFCPYASISKICFAKLLLISIIRDPLPTFAPKKSQALSGLSKYPLRYDLFQVSLIGFQEFFLFWVAGIILKAWDVELESAHFFAVMPSEKNSVHW